MQEPEVQGGCDGHTLWSPNFLNTQRFWRCSQLDTVPPGCRRKLPGHLRWIQKEECNLHASSSPSYWPALERCQQRTPATVRQGQSAAQPHCTLGGGEPRAVWDLPLYLLNIYKTYTQNSTTLRNPGKGREHWEHSTRQAAGASAFGFPRERRRRRRERGFISLD